MGKLNICDYFDMGNLGCCGSKKGKSFDADSLNEGYDYDLTSGAGMN